MVGMHYVVVTDHLHLAACSDRTPSYYYSYIMLDACLWGDYSFLGHA